MASLVQAVTADADPATVTFAAAPASGNLLVALQFQRADTANANFTAPAGWNATGVAMDVELANADFQRSCKLWWKIAGAGEPTSYSFDDGTTNPKRVVAANFAPGAGESFGASVLATAQSNNGAVETAGGTGLTYATGTTTSQSGKKLILGAIMIMPAGASDPVSLTSWTSEALTNALFVVGGDWGRTAGLAWAQVDNTATHASTCTFDHTGSIRGLMAGIAVFRINTTTTTTRRDLLYSGVSRGIARGMR